MGTSNNSTYRSIVPVHVLSTTGKVPGIRDSKKKRKSGIQIYRSMYCTGIITTNRTIVVEKSDR